jgi:UDP-glucose 4-epimerase
MNIADRRLKNVFKKFKPHYVYHFAFHVLVPESTKNPLLDMPSIAGSLNLLENAAQHKVKKIIFSSSGFLYGNTKHLPAKETEPVLPISPYIVSKYAVENYLKFFKVGHGLPYVILRYAAIYGPRQVTGAMADYIRHLARGRQAKMWGNGRKTRDYVYVADVVQANLSALKVKDDHPNPVFNVGTGKETTLNELYRSIAELLGKVPKPVYLPERIGEQIRYSLDHAKIRRELGWRPAVSLREGLREVLKYQNLL